MSVWLCIPSARPPEEAEKVLKLWRERGYKIALWQDLSEVQPCAGNFDYENEIVSVGEYPGYSKAVNHLIAMVMYMDLNCEWFVIGGDDVCPDPNHTAEEIALETSKWFGYGWNKHIPMLQEPWETPHPLGPDATFGVMQPTGDRFAEGSIDRICGSAWLGREFCRRINQGNGPLWPEYVHNFVDEELQNVAIKYGIFQQRRDLIHLHRHFQRQSDALNSPAIARPTPAHLKAAFSPEGWGPYKAIFEKRKREGFPGSEPIA
jgi:hypothetical protein